MSDFDLSKVCGNEPPLQTDADELEGLRAENALLWAVTTALVSRYDAHWWRQAAKIDGNKDDRVADAAIASALEALAEWNREHE
jgi:hypothetical protein